MRQFVETQLGRSLLAVNLTRKEFVGFRDRHYSGCDEEFHQQNIGKPLTDERIRKWFEWKNGPTGN